jgi:hypothetical protein
MWRQGLGRRACLSQMRVPDRRAQGTADTGCRTGCRKRGAIAGSIANGIANSIANSINSNRVSGSQQRATAPLD